MPIKIEVQIVQFQFDRIMQLHQHLINAVKANTEAITRHGHRMTEGFDKVAEAISSLKPPPQPNRLFFSKLSIGGLTIEGEIRMLRMLVGQKTTLTAGVVGNIEPGTSEWSDSASLGTLTENPDNELQSDFVASTLGETIIKVTADGRKGEGEVEINAVLTIVVAEPDAIFTEISATTPV